MYRKQMVSLFILGAIFSLGIKQALAIPLIDSTVHIYSQTLSFKTPVGWIPGSRVDSGSVFRLELIPPNEKIESWNSMLTVSGYRGLAGRMSSRQAYEVEAQSVIQACPGNSINQVVNPPGRKDDSVFALVGCKKHPSIPNKNEVAFYAFIRGKDDIYMIKKSFRELINSTGTRLNESSYSELAPEVLAVELSPAG
ncbi:MAG: hypothetical protein KDD70_04995 [Bdellovibrionales bacterium]|nr:hypothetical protein [Bdellovibrionales bacterium]